MAELKIHNDLTPAIAIPPGETLRDELHARDISQVELARRINRPQGTISQIISGKKAITAETAIQLESVFEGVSALFWLNLESRYRLTLARLAAAATA
jgi:HTH-type transcriptional regulator/antitoxin HigA